MQHNRALQRRHIRHVDEGVRHQARRALAEAANPQLRAARKHAVAQRHVQRVSERVHQAQVHRHSDRPAKHHRVEARRRPPAANRHRLRQRHATHAALRSIATTATGPCRRHVERQARLAHAAGTAAAHAVGERRSQHIEARQRSRTAVARHHAHGGQASHAVFVAAPQHPAAGTVALHRHDAARDRRPGDKRRAGGSAARNRHGAAAQRHTRKRRHRRRLAHRPHVAQLQPPADTNRPTVAAHQRRRNRPLDAHKAQHRIKHRKALAKDNAAAAAHNRDVRHGEHRVALQAETRRGRHMHRGRGRTARRLQRHAVKHHRARQQVHAAANVHRRPTRVQRPQHSVAHTQLRLQQRNRVQHKRRRHRVRQSAQLGVAHRSRRHNRRVTDRHVRVCRQAVHKHERAVAPGQPAHAHLQAPVTRRLAAVAPHVDLRTAVAHAVPQFDAQRAGKHRRNVEHHSHAVRDVHAVHQHRVHGVANRDGSVHRAAPQSQHHRMHRGHPRSRNQRQHQKKRHTHSRNGPAPHTVPAARTHTLRRPHPQTQTGTNRTVVVCRTRPVHHNSCPTNPFLQMANTDTQFLYNAIPLILVLIQQLILNTLKR
ncbi:hypothetical protein ECC02_011244 [Trypanosoma cruzi]|uniref:Uncharacterized protein n=1 Tax=Trypanosoma cruzi TaxID=5693 RepID=A0A7J6XNC0_TRYCR|nr:hypothetical protein ECC02_011244 [Trypanosoma cruzi]